MFTNERYCFEWNRFVKKVSVYPLKVKRRRPLILSVYLENLHKFRTNAKFSGNRIADFEIVMIEPAEEESVLAGHGVDDKVLPFDRILNSIKESLSATPFKLLVSDSEKSAMT